MTITKRKVLYEHRGENADSAYSPVGVASVEIRRRQVDLNEAKRVCVSYDNDMPTQIRRWKVHEVWLPDWLKVKEWASDVTRWAYFWALGGRPDWPEAWQRALSSLTGGRLSAGARRAIFLLVDSQPRTEFRTSVRSQVIRWAETPADDRQYATPLSGRQMQYITKWYHVRDADRIANDLYYARRHHDDVGVPATLRENQQASERQDQPVREDASADWSYRRTGRRCYEIAVNGTPIGEVFWELDANGDNRGAYCAGLYVPGTQRIDDMIGPTIHNGYGRSSRVMAEALYHHWVREQAPTPAHRRLSDDEAEQAILDAELAANGIRR